MTTITLPLSSTKPDRQLVAAVTEGLVSQPKWLPAWLFYDAAGSRLFDQITELPEYYLTRTERAILKLRSEEIIALAADSDALHLVELGAGSCDKTRILLKAAVDRQDTVLYEPVDVSPSALAEAQRRIEEEIPGVAVVPRVADYTHQFALDPPLYGHRRMVLYIGSSIGNFEPNEAIALLKNVRATLVPGDSLLLGVDMVKNERVLLDAYNDAAGVTAEFNRNILARLNRELGANFDPEAFDHRAVWNRAKSRIEIYLDSRTAQTVQVPGCDLTIRFERGESIHTENSYKYRIAQVESLVTQAGFTPEQSWTDGQAWFQVLLARAN